MCNLTHIIFCLWCGNNTVNSLSLISQKFWSWASETPPQFTKHIPAYTQYAAAHIFYSLVSTTPADITCWSTHKCLEVSQWQQRTQPPESSLKEGRSKSAASGSARQQLDFGCFVVYFIDKSLTSGEFLTIRQYSADNCIAKDPADLLWECWGTGTAQFLFSWYCWSCSCVHSQTDDLNVVITVMLMHHWTEI